MTNPPVSVGTKAAPEDHINEFAREGGVFIGYLSSEKARMTLKTPINYMAKVKQSCIHLVSGSHEIFGLLQKHKAYADNEINEHRLTETRRGYAVVVIDAAGKPDAINALRTLKEKHRDIPVIVLTANYESKEEEAARQAWYIYYAECGARYVLGLPTTTNNILNILGRAVKRPEEHEKRILAGEDEMSRYEQEGGHITPDDGHRLLEIAQEVLGKHPGYARALALRGRIRARLGDFETAVADLEQAAKGGHIAAIQAILEIHKRQGELDKAATLLEDIRRISSRNPDHIVAQGQIALLQDKPDQAVEYFKQAQASAHHIAKSISADIKAATDLAIAKSCLEANNTELAASYLESATGLTNAVSAESKKVFLDLGVKLCQQRRYKEAVEEYNKCMKLARADSVFHYNLAKAYYEWAVFEKKSREDQQAKIHFHNALDELNRTHDLVHESAPLKAGNGNGLVVKNVKVCINMAKMFNRLGDNPKAQIYADKAYRIDPHGEPVRRLLEEVLGVGQAREVIATAPTPN